MLKKLGGNRLSQAIPVPSTTSFQGKLTKTNRDDLLSFNLSSTSSLNLKFKSSGRPANISVIQDLNRNGLADANEILKSSAMRPGKTGAIALTSLAAGTYFVQVSAGGRGASNYRLAIATTASGQPQVQTTATDPQDFVNQVVALTNDFRRQNGLSALTLNSKLTTAAQTYSQTMALGDFFSHTGADGSQPWDRMQKAGYNWSVAAENIAAGQTSPAEVVQAWINSPEHRDNLLNSKIKDIGVGYYFLPNDTGSNNYNYYWTQDFGAPM